MSTLKVLMVAEKPILADSIAKILSNGQYTSRKGSNGICSVAEYSGQFKGQKAHFKFTSTCGHVMCVDFPAQYNSWDRIDPAELFVCPIEKNEANSKMRMNSFLAGEAKGCDILVLWLDCDKEGENIAFEVIDACSKSMNRRSGNFMDSVFRARFSAVSNDEIKKAMNNLVKPNQNESLSVDARQELDLRIGCAFTRFQTRYFQNKYGDLDSTLVSFGPCQTPTLAFCVQRHDIITQFKPEPYWIMKVEGETGTGRTLKLDWDRERIFDKDIAQVFLNRVKSTDKLIVEDLSSKEGKKEKPTALNTVELLRVGSSALGMSPQQTMSTAEHLYTRGFISYPRTETTSYPNGFNFHQVLRQHSSGKYASIVQNLLNQGSFNPKKGTDVGDHPPITPQKPNDGQLSGDGQRIYEYVLQHFLASIMNPCKYVTQTLKLTSGYEKFSIDSKRVIDPGFTEILTWQAVGESEISMDFKKGDKLAIKNAELGEKLTSPPGYLTESDLITLMEKFGIGTDASIPVHITNISQRNYVTVGSNRTLIPTKLGIALIRGYQHVDSELIQPTMRSEVEDQLNLIAKGQADFKTVKDHVLNMFRLKFCFFVENINLVDNLFEASFTSLAESGKPFSRCGKCMRYMKLVETRPQRLFCGNCNDTYSLPTGKDAQIRLHMERRCPLDGFDLLYFHTAGGKLAQNYAFCPFCFNYPPFESMRKGSGCNNCFHPSCPNSSITQGVAMCLNACSNETGVLVLDPQSGPKWKLSCNRCPSVVGVFEGALKVRVSEKRCNSCGALKLSCEYKDEKKSKLPNSELNYHGCIFCDHADKKVGDEILNLNHAHLSKEFKIGGGSRGRGARGSRGRGRGTRSRGRGTRGH